MRKEDLRPIAVVCGDIHLSHQAPVCRAEKNEDWYGVMKRYLQQLKHIAGEVPILCTGDVFDDGWRGRRCPPELINFAVENLPVMFAIPGQHDLPYHRYEDLRKSGYWTLVEAGKIVNLDPEHPRLIRNNFFTHAFPWGYEVTKGRGINKNVLNIAVIHSYMWTGLTGYPGAPDDKNLAGYIKRLKGYDIALFGDNHKGMPQPMLCGGCTVYGCGTFMRRKLDEIDYKPRVAVIYLDGKVKPRYLDCSEDRFVIPERLSEIGVSGDMDPNEFLEALKELGEVGVDFKEAVTRYFRACKKPNPGVEKIVREIIEEVGA